MVTGRLPQWRRRRDVALTWLATGVVVAAVYAGVMLLGRAVTGASAPLWLAILATGAVAVVIGPAQRWAAQATARVLRGSREPPYAVLAGFPARMEGGDAVTELPARMARLLAEATGARWAQVWLILGDRPTLVASHPPTTSTDLPPPSPSSRATGLRSVTVGHRGELLGFLRLQEHPGHPLTPVEERLFAGLAAQAGLALHAARVRAELETRHADLALRAAELRAARTRLVAAQDRFGCWSASFIDALASSVAVQPRNGPPEPVITTRFRSSRRSPRRAKASAACSESTGRSRSGSPLIRSSTNSPPTTRDSLFASASVFPFCNAANVGPRPEEPTRAFRTMSASVSAASRSAASGPLRTSTPRSEPMLFRTSSAAASSAIATTGGRNSRICPINSSWFVPATDRPTTLKRSGLRRTTSRAWVPTDPVEPRMVTLRMSNRLPPSAREQAAADPQNARRR